MSAPGPGRSLASLVHDEAPLAPRRAASVLVAVCRELELLTSSGTRVTDLSAERIELAGDGSARIEPGERPSGVGTGAGVGRLLFELLVGRAPLGTDDAFEPHLTSSLPSSTVALLACSCSDAPGQWPSVADWSAELALVAGGQAPAEPPRRIAARRRRRMAVALAVLALVVLSAVVVVLAPHWWDDATHQESWSGPLDRTAQETDWS